MKLELGLLALAIGISAQDHDGISIWLDTDPEGFEIEYFGPRNFHEMPDIGAIATRVLWVAYDCDGAELGRTHEMDSRWNTGFHAAPDENGRLGERTPATFDDDPFYGGAELPAGTATFSVFDRRSHENPDGEEMGPFRVPDEIWPCRVPAGN